jgi:putative oxidoreductase
MIERYVRFGQKMTTALQFVAPLLTRLVLGEAFFLTGWGKWRNFARTASFFSDLGIPFAQANAAFVSTLELVGGLCLMLGFGTRILAFLLSGTMVVALLTADKESFVKNFPSVLTDVVPVVYGMFLIWLILYGSGRLSIDSWISRRRE